MENKQAITSGYYLHYANDKVTIRYSATQGQFKTLTDANAALKIARAELTAYNQTAFNYKGLLA